MNGLSVDLSIIMDPGASGDAGVPDGAELLAFASAANRKSASLPAARETVRAAVGDEGLIEAAATVAIFNGLVRVADGTGIQLDPALMASTADLREALALDSFAGSANSEGQRVVDAPPADAPISSLFG